MSVERGRPSTGYTGSFSYSRSVQRLSITSPSDILLQGFFSALFTSGFLESSPRRFNHQQGPEEIDVVFDDRNITRAGMYVLASTPHLPITDAFSAFEYVFYLRRHNFQLTHSEYALHGCTVVVHPYTFPHR